MNSEINSNNANSFKTSEEINIISNLAKFDEADLVENVFSLNPIYLKDLLKW